MSYPGGGLREREAGFSLIELLTVVAVLGILMAVLLPSVGAVRESARRAAAQTQLREIHAAYLAYTEQGARARAIDASSVHDWARVLAQEANLNDARLWFVAEDPLVERHSSPPRVVATPPSTGAGDWQLHPSFADFPISFAVANRLSTQAPASTPLAWTRGLTPDGTWADFGTPEPGVYGSDGGFVVFLDGSVRFYQDLGSDGGQLVDYRTQQPTGNILEALSPGSEILDFSSSGR